jgi:hypothetical protein
MPYERIQDPVSNPSPTTSIDVFNPSSNKNVKGFKVKAIVDTGAGITCLPESVIAKLGDLRYTLMNVRSPLDKNKVIPKKQYLVRLELGGTIHDIEAIGISKDYGIIGRDILHRYKIVLDSHNEQWGFDCRWNHGTTCDGDNCIVPISS